MATSTALHKLNDSELTVADPAEDIRERDVYDSSGEKIGEVDDLLIDDEGEHRVRMLQMESGGFLGIGETKTLLPIDAITRITEDRVYIDKRREDVYGAPTYDPELEPRPDLYYGYYGYAPYWAGGYVYPMYPRYPIPPSDRGDEEQH